MGQLKLGLVFAGATGLLMACGGPEELGSTTSAAGVDASLAQTRAATADFHETEDAQAAGWDLVPGLDHCFTNQPVGDMGYHYINVGILDTTVDEAQPEAMVYIPQDGELKLAAVEYIVPADAWDAEGHGSLPSAHGQEFHLNAALGVYVLHAWIWRNNPAGIFQDWNPTVTCD